MGDSVDGTWEQLKPGMKLVVEVSKSPVAEAPDRSIVVAYRQWTLGAFDRFDGNEVVFTQEGNPEEQRRTLGENPRLVRYTVVNTKTRVIERAEVRKGERVYLFPQTGPVDKVVVWDPGR